MSRSFAGSRSPFPAATKMQVAKSVFFNTPRAGLSSDDHASSSTARIIPIVGASK